MQPRNCADGNISASLPLQKYVKGPKLGLSHFPGELAPMPWGWARLLGKVVVEREHSSGGHFAAWERPEELVADVRDMFAKSGPAHGVVAGSSGY